jgi:hypothetical protein
VSSLPLLVTLLIFLAAAGAIWVAGIVRGERPLTYRAASLVLLLEGALVVAVLAVVIAGTQLPASLIVWRITPQSVLIAVLWIAGLFLLKRAGTGCRGMNRVRRQTTRSIRADTAARRVSNTPPRRA